jgi:pilus assembly protein FimV
MRFRVIGTAASLLVLASSASFALTIGDIQLRSALNAPLNAEIELTGTIEELASVRAQLAPREAFTRYGLDYPAYFAGIQVRTERLQGGRTVVRLSTAAPITEPFATLLVQTSTENSTQLREYTVLFDPPAFAPVQSPAAPIAAPAVGAGDRSATIVRQAQAAPAAAPQSAVSQPAAAPAASAGAPSGDYMVRKGDSLSAIARSQFGTGDADQAMVAIYRGNQGAFEGNMNRLRAGAVLRMPDAAALDAVDARAAAVEIRQQATSWRASTSAGSATGADPRLRLIPPAAAGSAGGSGDSQALRDQLAASEAERAELRNQLELRNAELARLKGTPAPASAQPAPAPVDAPSPPPAETQPAATAEPATPVAVDPAPAPKPAPKKPAADAARSDAGSSLLDQIKAFWFVPAGLLALLLAFVGVRAARRRSSSAGDMTPFAVAPAGGRDTSSDTLPLRKPVTDREDPILVEESGTHERLSIPRKDTHTVALDDSSASMSVPALDATAALQAGDPLADADFHMAYGLYDQAADLVKLAIQREPSRRDLKLKLLEVFFVWGNKDQFLQVARELSDTRDAGAPGEWEKVVIMGKQLAPDDALFSQSYSGAGQASVDLNLEGGQNLIDFDLHGEPSASLTNDGGVDLGLGMSLSNESSDVSGLDFVLDDPARGSDLDRTATTREMVLPGLEGLEGTAERLAVDGPTVEQPTLDDLSDTLVGKLDAHSGFQGSSDQTAELAIDDLGLDLGKFDATGTNTNLLDDSQLVRALEGADDAPTLVAGLDETSRRLLTEAGEINQPTQLLPAGDANQLTELLPLSGLMDDDGGATAMVSALDTSVLDMDFDLDGNAATGKRPGLSAGDGRLDLDVGAVELPGDGEYQRTQLIEPVEEATQKDLEPVTMSEVGTKLDLARAYMDMGDPDGARSILREVLQEGSTGQRQEAQRLIDSIPG